MTYVILKTRIYEEFKNKAMIRINDLKEKVRGFITERK